MLHAHLFRIAYNQAMKEKKTPLKTLETELRKIHKTCRAVDQKAEKNVQLWTIYIDCLLANIPGE